MAGGLFLMVLGSFVAGIIAFSIIEVFVSLGNAAGIAYTITVTGILILLSNIL